MRLRDPKASDERDGRPDSVVYVSGNAVMVDGDGVFSHPAIDEQWARGYAERNGYDLGDVLVGERVSEASAASDDEAVCGTEMSDGSICTRPVAECPYH